MNRILITRTELLNMGVVFATEQETQAFIRIISDELSERVRKASAHLSGSGVVPPLDETYSENEKSAWLFDHVDAYREICERCKVELVTELEKYRGRIAGLVEGDEPPMRAIPIEDLDLSVRVFNSLKRAGLNNVGDLLDHGDLASVRNLGKKGYYEVEKVLNNLRLNLYDYEITEDDDSLAADPDWDDPDFDWAEPVFDEDELFGMEDDAPFDD